MLFNILHNTDYLTAVGVPEVPSAHTLHKYRQLVYTIYSAVKL